MPSCIRWGIVSTGKISNDFVTSIKHVLDPSEHKVVAVSSRSLSSAQKFSEKFSIAKAYEGFEGLVNDDEVDIVYVGSITTEHHRVASAALEAGKHVLCEKPMGMSLKATESLIALAQSKGLFLMEAIWSRFLPCYSTLRSKLESIGEVEYVTVEFGRKIRSERIRKMDLGGGTVLDLGVYCVQLLNLVFKGEEPSQILTSGSLNSEKTDRNTSSIFKYGNGSKIGITTTHSEINMPCEGRIFGSKGSLTLKFPFWVPEVLEVKLNSVDGPPEVLNHPFPVLPEGSEYSYNYVNSAGLAFEAKHVKECLDKGLKESPLLDHKAIVQISKHMEKIRKDIGVIYPQDSMI